MFGIRPAMVKKIQNDRKRANQTTQHYQNDDKNQVFKNGNYTEEEVVLNIGNVVGNLNNLNYLLKQSKVLPTTFWDKWERNEDILIKGYLLPSNKVSSKLVYLVLKEGETKSKDVAILLGFLNPNGTLNETLKGVKKQRRKCIIRLNRNNSKLSVIGAPSKHDIGTAKAEVIFDNNGNGDIYDLLKQQ